MTPPPPPRPGPLATAALKARVRERARALGLESVGFSPAAPGAEASRLAEWLGRGHHGAMAWLERDPVRRGDPRVVMPSVRTVVVAAAAYDTDAPRTAEATAAPGRGWISRYAWGDDYHDWLRARMDALLAVLREELGEDVEARVYVDTGPVLEKAQAERAGLGWIGKNACLISPQHGSYLFLGVILLAAEIAPDTAGVDRCGTCRACLDVCPTDAFPEPYVLDARRCISYLTIEHRGDVDPTLEAAMGPHVFGCDLCQDVCPWNRRGARTDAAQCVPRPGSVAPDLVELAALDDDAFRERFRRSPVKRTKPRGLRRNVAIALGNGSAPAEATRVSLERLAGDPEPVVAGAARRALARIEAREAGDDDASG